MSSSTTMRTGGSSGGGTGGGGTAVNREVAKGVANLGNTCYMNAVLQALAHAPELCLAIDCEPHRAVCPIAKKNRVRRKEEEENKSKNPPSNSIKGEEKKAVPEAAPEKGKAKKSKKGKGRSPPRTEEPEASKDPYADDIFCALCEVERHLERVHAGDDTAEKVKAPNGKNTPNPIAYPTTFVNGFISKVAPWFKRGVQEDSHEFLRLLIEAMQKSSTAEGPDDADNNNDNNYSFKLFRGTVESNVRCSSCKANNSKVEFFEDIGLDVTPLPPSSDAGSTAQSSQSLADVTSALERFIHAENLDSAYKCESCGKLGRAVKQSFLHSIPPIVTLHLKRFRYGASNASSSSNISDEALLNTRRTGSAKIEGHIRFDQVLDIRPYLTKTLQDKHRAMLCRLFAVVVHTGKNSHSGHYVAYVRNVAKNEWWRMDDARVSRATQAEVMGAEAYMLFYRVVDHPVAVQLRSKMKTQQQKMQQKVSQDNKNDIAAGPVDSAQTSSSSSTVTPDTLTPKESQALPTTAHSTDNKPKEDSNTSNTKTRKRKREKPKYKTGEEWARANTKILSPAHPSSSKDKGSSNSYLTSKVLLAVIKRAEEFVAEHLEFKAEYFKLLTDEAAAAASSAPSSNTSSSNKKKKTASGGTASSVTAEDSILKDVSVEDVKGEAEDLKRGLIDLFCQLAEASGGIDNFIIPQQPSEKNDGETVNLESEDEQTGNLIVPVVETNETLV